MDLSTDTEYQGLNRHSAPAKLVDSVTECTVTTTHDFQCLSWDLHCEILFGVPRKEALHSLLPEILHGVEPLVSENILRQAAFTGDPRLIILPEVNNVSARTLQVEIYSEDSTYYIHAKLQKDRETSASKENTDSASVFTINNRASAITYVSSKKDGFSITYMSADLKDIFPDSSITLPLERSTIERKIHPNDRRKVSEAYATALSNGTRFSIDYRLIENDESVRWYHEEATPLGTDSFNLHGVIVSVNGQMAAEETLKNTADHALELLANAINSGLIFLKGNRIRYANQAFANLTGFDLDSLRGNPLTDIVVTDSKQRIESWLANQPRNEGEPEDIEFQIGCTPPLTVLMHLNHVNIFGQLFTIGTIRDISQEDKMQHELTRLASIPDLNPYPIVEVTLTNEITYLNQAALETFPSLPLLEEEHPVMQTIFTGVKALSDGGHQNYYHEATVGDRIYAEHLTSIPATDEVRIYLSDITERREYEDNLAEAKQMAETANQLKSEFLANMSHEIRTPLNIILGYTDLVKEVLHGYSDNNCDKYFSYIHNAGDQLTQTIDKIIDISRFHISDFPLVPQVLPLSHMVSECVQGFKVLADQNHLSLGLTLGSEDCCIYADPYAMSEAITNVIGNAIKYTLEGEVRVGVSKTADGHIELRVEDTGIGISEDFLPHLFDEFSQEEGGYGRPFEGTGLGLALTKKFIDASGGSISVESIKGEGTTFYMTFPSYNGTDEISKEKIVPMTESNDTVKTAQSEDQKNILVVEDDTLTQDFMKILLGKRYNKFFAMSANEANSVLEANHINIILMDLSIKGNEDGITLTKAIRSHPDWKDIPIIALTAHAFARDRENAIAAGCNAFFSKPFNRTELLNAIEQLAIP